MKQGRNGLYSQLKFIKYTNFQKNIQIYHIVQFFFSAVVSKVDSEILYEYVLEYPGFCTKITVEID
jgi:hypothetical protein